MFVLEEPYVSDFLTDTLNKCGYPVLGTKIIEGKINNVISDSEFIEKFKSFKKVYTNSENSLDRIVSNLSGTDVPKFVQLFKDKAKFRNLLKTIFPEFYFKEISLDELDSIDENSLKYPFVIKPSTGFLSIGVYTVYEKSEFKPTVKKIKESLIASKGLFPKTVLNPDKFLIEEYIEGDEYAVDAYFDNNSKPVILNVYKHPFADKYDVSDRMYLTSPQIINENKKSIEQLLAKISDETGLVNFPIHIELRIKNNVSVPIEINPLRFCGWCLTDLAYFAYGINVYEYFEENKKPDWELISKRDDSTYAFVLCEVPSDINKEAIISFDIESFCKDTNAKILEMRKFDFKTKPMFAALFIKTDNPEKIKHVLKLDVRNYIKVRNQV